MKVEIFSDVVCPWCYIGHTRFARAAELYRAKGGEVEVTLRPFQLAPDDESDGSPLTLWLERKFGGQAGRMLEHVTQVAGESGLELRFDAAVHANTFLAHQLIVAADRQGKGTEMAERLFRAHFADGLDVGSAEVLAKLAAEAGVTEATADDTAAVRADLDRARQFGITGVPFFLFEGQFGISGAQPEDTLLAAIEEVAERTGQALTATQADTCDDDGYCAV